MECSLNFVRFCFVLVWFLHHNILSSIFFGRIYNTFNVKFDIVQNSAEIKLIICALSEQFKLKVTHTFTFSDLPQKLYA